MPACVLSRFNRVQLFVTPWTVDRQAPPSMGFSRQEYWSGLPCPPPGNLPNPGIKPTSLTSPALAGGFFTTSATWEAQNTILLSLLGEFICSADNLFWLLFWGFSCVWICLFVCFDMMVIGNSGCRGQLLVDEYERVTNLW